MFGQLQSHGKHFFILPLTCLAALLVTGRLAAQEQLTTATQNITAQAQQSTESAWTTIRKALNGDTQAVSELTAQYLFPAIVALIILVIGYLVASFFGRIVGSGVSRKVDATLGRFAGKMTKILIMTLVLLSVLTYFGVDVTSFAALLAAAGFAIGMALQGTLSNFAAGIMLLIFRPFKIGQYIKAADVEGTVEGIDLFTTHLNTPDNRHLVVPNGQIFGSTITNYTYNELRRVDVSVGVDYAADIEQTRAVLQAVIGELENVVDDPPPQTVLTELADSSVKWQARVWCQPEHFWAVKEDLTVLIKKGLDLNKINIPYPQLVLHLTKDHNANKKVA